MPSRPFVPFAALLFAVAAGSTTPALASSPSAWEEFRRDVETSCREASVSHLSEPTIVVDPFGLQSYGLAFLSGAAVEDGAPRSLVCIYDKAAGTVEIGGAMALESTVPTLRPDLSNDAESGAASGAQALPERLLSPSALAAPVELAPATSTEGAAPVSGAAFAEQCDGPCESLLADLAEEDRAALEALPAQIERTIAANNDASLNASVAAVRDGAGTMAAAVRANDADALAPDESFVGSASCTLYYFGFGGEAARTVGTHQCRVTAGEEGALVMEKTSGERLRAEIAPLAGSVGAFRGRSFEAGAALQDYDRDTPLDLSSPELGNIVGLAGIGGDRLVLVSSQLRRFDPSDTFFWALAMDRP